MCEQPAGLRPAAGFFLMAFSLLIGGAPYRWKRGTLNIVETLGGRSTCEFSIDNPDGSITAPQVGQSVLIKDGTYTIFAGSIESVEALRYPGTLAGLWRISCVDHHRILDRRITGQQSWQGVRAGDIVTGICTGYLEGEGVGIDFVQQGPVIERFEIDHATVAEALQKLAELAGMVWYIDYGRQLRFFAPNSYACPFELEPDSRNFQNLALRTTREQYANRIIAKIGQFVRDPQTARFDANGRTGEGEEPLDWMKPDGSRKRWAVTYPVHAAPTVRVNGSPRVVGTYGDESAEFYWQTGSREISQSENSQALAPGDVLEITYVGLSSEVLTVENAGEISRRAAVEGHTGIYEKLVDTSEEMTRADARQYAKAALDRLDSLSAVAVIDTNTFIEPLASTARVGQFIHIDVDGYRLDWKPVTAVEYGTPAIITVPGHSLMDGARIRLHQVPGLNGVWSVQVVDEDRLRLVGSSAAGMYSGGGMAHPLTYLIRQIRTADVAGQLSVQLECVMGPMTDDAASFFRDLAAAQGIPPSAPRLDKPANDLPAVTSLAAVIDGLDDENRTVAVRLTGVAPQLPELAQVRVYIEIPRSDDEDLEHPTMPGQAFYLGPHYVEPGQQFSLDLAIPYPPAEWLAQRYAQIPPDGSLRIRWLFYVLTETWTECAELVRLSSLDPPAPANASPWASLVVDFTGQGAQAAMGRLGPAILGVTVATDAATRTASIRIDYNAIYPSLSLQAANLYTVTQADPQPRPHGRWPYVAPGPGRAVATLPLPPAPLKAVAILAGEWPDGYIRPLPTIVWDENGDPANLPEWAAVVLLSPETITLGEVSVVASHVEFRQLEGGWSYRIAITLGGDGLLSPEYGGTSLYARFSDDPEPQSAADWLALRATAEHRPGDAATIYSDWWTVVPGTQRQYWLRPLVRDRSAYGRTWGAVAGPYMLHLPLGDAVPGVDHEWGFSAQLNGYWDDGNGIRYGKVDLSWNPLPQAGVVYGVYEYRSPDDEPPPYSLYKPTEANTTAGSVTMWVPPPVGDGEYLHLALVAQLPADGVWPKPSDYPDGKLPVTTVFLPKAGLSDQVSGWQVTVETDQSQDVPRGRFVFAFTPPNDPDFHHVHVYRRPANAQGAPTADWLPDKVASITTGGPGGWWPLPSQPEYWLFKAVACNSLGQENDSDPPTVLVDVPTSDGVKASRLAADAVAGPIALDSQGRATIPPGAILAEHIGAVSADSIVGQIKAEKIESISASQITGQIQASQIAGVSASQITGQILAEQIQNVAANQISGTIQAGQIGSVNAASITGVIVSQQLADQILESARLIASSLRVPTAVATLPQLPSVNFPPGSLALRTSDNTLWRNQNGVWVQTSASGELTGRLTANDIQSINAQQIVGLITAGQIQNINAEQIQGLIQSGQIQSINGSKIEIGSITSDKIASINGAKIEIGTLNGDAITIGSITGNKIAIGAITGDKIAAGAITADKISAGAITADKIAAGAITTEKLAAGTITADKIAVGTITADRIVTVNASSVLSGPGNEVSGDFWVSGKLRVGNGIDVAYGADIALQGGTVYATTLQAPTVNALTQLNVGGNAVRGAAFCDVGSGSGKVASGTHTHTIAITLSVSKKTIWWRDPSDNWYSDDVVTDVSIASVSVGGPQ